MSSPRVPQLPDARSVLSRLSYRHGDLLRAMISLALPSKAPRAALANRASSVGSLDCLPPEIMSLTLGALDARSLAHFARVSFQGHAFVQSLQVYRDLVEFVPEVLWALGEMGLIHLHSMAQLYDALQSERCATCNQYGAFLFLPTCRRCCWQCLRCEPSLRLISHAEAKRYFGLSERHLRRLPACHIIPGTYGLDATPAPGHSPLVAIKAAMDLGLEVHGGSAERLAHIMARRCRSSRLVATGRYLQGGSGGGSGGPDMASAHQGQDALMKPCQGNIPHDKYFCMASIPFPSLSKSTRTIENGLWCRGCEFTHSRYRYGRLTNDLVSANVPSDCEPQRVLIGLERRARSREVFLDHIGHCYGAGQLAPDLLTGTVQ